MTSAAATPATPLTPPPTTEKPTTKVRVEVDTALVVGNRQLLKQRVIDLLAEGKREFVIDFAKCTNVDNSGLGVLVACLKRIREHKGELVFEGVNEDLVTLFEMTKLDTLFTIRRA